MTQLAGAAPSDLQELLRTSSVTEIRCLESERTDNYLVLRGVVCSFYYKQLAQELVRGAAAGLEIDNQICVEYAHGERAWPANSVVPQG